MSTYIPKITYTPSGGSLTTITFDYPPKGKDPFGSQINAIGKVSESVSGETQTVVNFLEETYDLTFSFLSAALKDEIRTFLLTHAFLGEEFDYYFDKDEATFVTVELDKSSRRADFKALLFKGSDDDFIYEIKLKFRRVL